jgi:hypothetical protein
MSPSIRGALKHAVFLGFVSVALLSAAALGGGGCPPADAEPALGASWPRARARPQTVNMRSPWATPLRRAARVTTPSISCAEW